VAKHAAVECTFQPTHSYRSTLAPHVEPLHQCGQGADVGDAIASAQVKDLQLGQCVKSADVGNALKLNIERAC
jgi:hypothetical protein